MDVLGQARRCAERLVTTWQTSLGDDIAVVLGGSLVSGLFVLDEETEAIDVDVNFLVDEPEDESVWYRIQTVTGLKVVHTMRVKDWPSGESTACKIMRFMDVPEVSVPLEIDGTVRNRRYVGWARFYTTVLTDEERASFREKKAALRGSKVAYTALKQEVLAEVQRRCLERGLVREET